MSACHRRKNHGTNDMDTDDFSNTAEAFEAFDDVPLSPARDDSIGSVIARRFSRRDMLRGSLGVAASTALFGTAALSGVVSATQAGAGAFAFTELADGMDETHHVAEGYDADILIRWGDPLFYGIGPFDPLALTGDEQAADADDEANQMLRTLLRGFVVFLRISTACAGPTDDCNQQAETSARQGCTQFIEQRIPWQGRVRPRHRRLQLGLPAKFEIRPPGATLARASLKRLGVSP